jgi:hypothetical protein
MFSGESGFVEFFGALNETLHGVNCSATMTLLMFIRIIPALALPVISLTPTATVIFLLTAKVLLIVPAVLHKQDTLAAGIVVTAMSFPLLSMTRGYAQIDGRSIHRNAFNGYRLPIQHLRLRIAADINPAIEAGLTNVERNTHVGGKCLGVDGRQRNSR